ncbi:hypothetical protein [Streptococcus cristatus]|nr:hypothetical protein [Streptococcus cristatus]
MTLQKHSIHLLIDWHYGSLTDQTLLARLPQSYLPFDSSQLA